jgi:hypothetical protein
MQLFACLESISRYVKNYQRIYVIYRASDQNFKEGYEKLKRSFQEVHFISQSDQPEKDFKPLLLDTLFSEKGKKSPYVVFGVDDDIVKDFVDLEKCIQAMEGTQAYAFYLKMGRHTDYCYTLDQEQGVPPSVPLGEGVYAWQFKAGKYDWDYPNTVDMTLYRKSDIENDLRSISFKNPNTFEGHWSEIAHHEKVGLYFDHSKIVNIPVNLVSASQTRCMNSYTPEQLLALFNRNLKINIDPLFQIENQSVHIDHEISFAPSDYLPEK